MKNQVVIIYEEDTTKLNICGRPFVAPGGKKGRETLLSLTRQIIGCNQYHVELIRENGVVIDAGANIGVFSVFAAVNHPQASIYAFEPTPSTYAILKENTKYYPNIKTFNHGLGEKVKTASLITADTPGQNYIGEGGGGILVRIGTVDELNLPVSFIKIDTEGYEANILKGAGKTIKKYKPIIVMSAYHKSEDETELPRLLNGIAAYDCELRNDCEEDLICKPVSF